MWKKGFKKKSLKCRGKLGEKKHKLLSLSEAKAFQGQTSCILLEYKNINVVSLNVASLYYPYVNRLTCKLCYEFPVNLVKQETNI